MPSAMTSRTWTVRQLAERLGGTIEGDATATIRGIAALETAGPEELTFVADARRSKALAESKAGAALVAKDAALGRGVAVGPGVVIGPGAQIAPAAVLCANVSVGAGAVIGESTILYPGTVVERRCRVGRRCRIGPNAVIGSSGFGYFFAAGRHNPVNHIGIVEIGDDVDIGACACVDRAKFGATRVGDGTKIDNLVQVAHNVQIGKNCLLAALVGIAGSTRLKEYVVLGGHVGVRDNITVGSGVQIGACSGIAQDAPDGAVLAGIPAIDAAAWLRGVKLFARSAELYERIKTLEQKVKALESAKDHP